MLQNVRYYLSEDIEEVIEYIMNEMHIRIFKELEYRIQ